MSANKPEGGGIIDNIHTHLAEITERAVYAENFYNNADITDDEKSEHLSEFSQELNRYFDYIDAEVAISGTLLRPTLDSNGVVEGMELATSAAPEEGSAKGFGIAPVPITIEGFMMGTYYYLCHVIYTRSSEEELNDGSVLQRHFRTFFPVKFSQVTFLESGYAHDINKLREADDRIIDSIDAIAYDDTITLHDRLRRLDDLFGRNMERLSEEDKVRYISYLNSLQIINSGFQHVLAEYALVNENDEESVWNLRNKTVPYMSVSGFTLTKRYRVRGLVAKERTPGLGITGKSYYGPNVREATVILPLNQEIVIEDPTEEADL